MTLTSDQGQLIARTSFGCSWERLRKTSWEVENCYWTNAGGRGGQLYSPEKGHCA